MANYLFERIDRLIIESPESLGIPEYVADHIRDKIEHRKAQDYIARWFKGMDHGFPNHHINGFMRDVMSNFRVQELEKVARKMGIRWDDEQDERKLKKDLKRRIEYDIMLNKKVTELIDFRKRVHKALKGEGVRSRMKKALGEIDYMIVMSLNNQILKHYPDLIEFLNSDQNAWRKVKGAKDVEDAADVAAEELEKMSYDETHIVHKFPDGYFWYEVVNPQECKYEADKMQHCGEPTMHGSTMFSLRDENNNPHMTVEYNKRENAVPQIRGKQNEVPKDTYWKYLDALFSKVIKTRPLFTDVGMFGEGRLITGLEDYIDDLNGIIYWNGAKDESESIAGVASDVVDEHGGLGAINGNRNIIVQGVWSDHEVYELSPSMEVAYLIDADEVGATTEDLKAHRRTIEKFVNGFGASYLLDGEGWQGQDNSVFVDPEGHGRLKIVMDFNMIGESLHGQDQARWVAQDTEFILSEDGRQRMIGNVRKALEDAGVPLNESADVLSEGWYQSYEKVPRVHPKAYHGSRTEGIKKLRGETTPYRGGIGRGVYVSYYKRVANFYGKHLYEVKLGFPSSKVFVIDSQSVMWPEFARGYSLLSGESLETFAFQVGGKSYLVSRPHWEDQLKEAHKVGYVVHNWWDTDIPVEAMEALNMADEGSDYALAEFPDLDERWSELSEGMRPVVVGEWEAAGGSSDIDFSNPPSEYIDLEIEIVSGVIEELKKLADKADEKFDKEYDEIIDLEDVGWVVEKAGYKAVWFVGMRGGHAEVNTELLVFDPDDVEVVRQLK